MNPHAILFIDDNSALASAYQLSLGERGFHVLIASNGDEALDLCVQEEGASLAIVDLKMPGMDGPQTIAALRQRRPGLKIIAMSGQPLVPYFSRLSDLGIRIFLSKPFSIEALICGMEELHVA
jgi:CheY-like chemotaxis protein